MQYTINLLPWRTQLRRSRKLWFYGAWISSVALCFFCCLFAHIVLNECIRQEKIQNYSLQQQQELTQGKLKKQQLFTLLQSHQNNLITLKLKKP